MEVVIQRPVPVVDQVVQVEVEDQDVMQQVEQEIHPQQLPLKERMVVMQPQVQHHQL